MLTLKQKSKSKVPWAPFYNVVSHILSAPGLNYFSDTFRDALWKKVVIYAIFTFEIFTGCVCFAGIILPNSYDMEDKISCLITLFTQTNSALKVITLIHYSAELKKLSEAIIGETSRDDLDSWEIQLAEKYHRYAKWICIQVIFLYTLTMVAFIGLPVFVGKAYNMPMLMEFPGTSNSGHPGYEINYLLGTSTVCYIGTTEMGFDIPAFLQICFISYQLDRCIYYCNMIGDLDTVYNTQEKQSQLLKKCIQLHATIFGFIQQVAAINTSVIALTIITSVPLLTTLLYSILVGSVSAAPFLMTAAAFHLFMYCFLGEIVSLKCREASIAIYTSQWYRIESAHDKRTFLFFFTVSQCDMRFSSGGLYNLSLETYTELMKRIYGAYAFLREVL